MRFAYAAVLVCIGVATVFTTAPRAAPITQPVVAPAGSASYGVTYVTIVTYSNGNPATTSTFPANGNIAPGQTLNVTVGSYPTTTEYGNGTALVGAVVAFYGASGNLITVITVDTPDTGATPPPSKQAPD